ncbi:cartilage matrix protein [Folsomia candida]|uniref:cartilage matrix protein n=1 Tax=Folsomia candida TaxID=158441 RepID=UPI000B8F1E87|nr:cartilage matrix protein [Folsomia candida]
MSTFSSSVNPVVSLNFVADWDTLKAQILGAAHSKGGTNTHLALDSAIAQTVPLRRTDIPQNVVVLTDGMSNNMPLTTEAAHRALDAGLEMFAVGIGNYDVNELKEISGYRQDRLFTVDQFNELVQVLRTLSRRICPDYK